MAKKTLVTSGAGFIGLPNPPEAITGHSGKWYRHIQLSPWIKEYWIE